MLCWCWVYSADCLFGTKPDNSKPYNAVRPKSGHFQIPVHHGSFEWWSLVCLNIVTINTAIAAIGGDSFLGDSFYWSSVEETESNAGIVNINNGQSSAVLKGSLNSVRAIRSF